MRALGWEVQAGAPVLLGQRLPASACRVLEGSAPLSAQELAGSSAARDGARLLWTVTRAACLVLLAGLVSFVQLWIILKQSLERRFCAVLDLV